MNVINRATIEQNNNNIKHKHDKDFGVLLPDTKVQEYLC